MTDDMQRSSSTLIVGMARADCLPVHLHARSDLPQYNSDKAHRARSGERESTEGGDTPKLEDVYGPPPKEAHEKSSLNTKLWPKDEIPPPLSSPGDTGRPAVEETFDSPIKGAHGLPSLDGMPHPSNDEVSSPLFSTKDDKKQELGEPLDLPLGKNHYSLSWPDLNDSNKSFVPRTNDAANVSLEQPDRAYYRCYPVPGSRSGKKLYPLQPIAAESAEHELLTQYETIVAILKAIVDRDAVLRDRASLIDYSLCMVGTSPENISPSIIIYSKRENIGRLRTIFRSNPIVSRQPSSRMLGRFARRSTITSRAPLKLVYYGTVNPPCERHAADLLTIHVTSEGLCGSLLTYQTRAATLAVLLQVGSKLRGLTVHHLFDPRAADGSKSPELQILQEGTMLVSEHDEGIAMDDASPSSATASNEQALWEDDSDVDETFDQAHEQPLIDESFKHGTKAVKGDELVTIGGHIVQPSNRLSESEPYLDWALIELHRDGIFLDEVESHSTVEKQGSAMLMREIALEPRFHAVPVTIIAGRSGLLTGMLLKVASYVGSNRGQELCRVWTVILDSSTGM